MSEEIRIIHPDTTHEHPLLDLWSHRKAIQQDFLAAWALGLTPTQQQRSAPNTSGEEYFGRLDPAHYLPDTPPHERTYLALYENTTEGMRVGTRSAQGIDTEVTDHHFRELAWLTGTRLATVALDTDSYLQPIRDISQARAFTNEMLLRRSGSSAKVPRFTWAHHRDPNVNDAIAEALTWHFNQLLPPAFWHHAQQRCLTPQLKTDLLTGFQGNHTDPSLHQGRLDPSLIPVTGEYA